MSAKKPAPAVDRRSQQAIETFEKAMKALGKHDYERAREHFDALIAGFPEERDLLERARSYRAVCERALRASVPPSSPRPSTSCSTTACTSTTGASSRRRSKFLRQAAEMHPSNEHVLYCLAATSARAGDTATALQAPCARPSEPAPQPRPGHERLRLRHPARATRSSCRSCTRIATTGAQLPEFHLGARSGERSAGVATQRSPPHQDVRLLDSIGELRAPFRPCILAAGKGTRMKSARAKVLHPRRWACPSSSTSCARGRGGRGTPVTVVVGHQADDGGGGLRAAAACASCARSRSSAPATPCRPRARLRRPSRAARCWW